ncbi:MAG: hypothetical protein A2Z08_01710 [Deltaproteobacteria bacterium RBG_16_54_11]|jgi:hypothetical protein|nr:MAG: hypothetical protein A2Z08_01710 [Deltaproteobacteria bacterium RBG_16_54_11]
MASRDAFTIPILRIFYNVSLNCKREVGKGVWCHCKRGHTQRELGQGHAPIGLAINAETPEELAWSVVVERIKVRARANPAQEKSREI